MHLMPKTDVAPDLRTLLHSEFLDRCKRNSRYSLRAFARSLNIAASPLSAILRNKRKLTPIMAQRLGRSLGLPEETVAILSGVSIETSYEEIPAENFEVIADWYHFAILELTKIPGFKPSFSHVARRLSISESEAKTAVEKLFRLGLLKKQRGLWKDASAAGNATSRRPNTTSEAARRLQRQLMKKGYSAIEAVPFELRSHSSMTVTVDVRDIPKVREKILKFRREMDDFLTKGKKPSEVYNLSIAFFPLTSNSRK